MLNNSSGQRLISEDVLNKLNVVFVLRYPQMQEGEFTNELKQQLNDALEGLARKDQTVADAVDALNASSNEGLFLKNAKTILMPAGGGLRKTRGRRLAKKTRRS